MKTIKIVYQIDAGAKHCVDAYNLRQCHEYDYDWEARCKIYRVTLKNESQLPLRCQGCLDAEKEYNKLKDCP